jgi:hypothetical protein
MSATSETIGVITGIFETIFFAPLLLAYLAENRKRWHAVELSLEEANVPTNLPHLAGLDDLINDIQDLIDRARSPEAYADLRLGNEILIAGPALSGKKSLALYIGKAASFDRVITVHNPRNVDALARAKHLAKRSGFRKTLLILPRLDLIDGREDEEVLAEIDALIETVSELSNTLIIGTTNKLVHGNEIDNLFGITLVLPGAPIEKPDISPLQRDSHRMLAEVASYYVNDLLKNGYALEGISRDGFIARVLVAVDNPAHVQDIVTLCETTAIYQKRKGCNKNLVITPDILELAVRRVVVTEVAMRG